MDSLKKEIKEKKIDFIATAISHWHAVGIDAYLYNISKNTGKKLNGIIIIHPHPKDGHIICEEDFFCRKFTNSKFYYSDYSENEYLSNNNFFLDILNIVLGIKNSLHKKKNDIHVISPMKPEILIMKAFKDKTISNMYRPHFVIIDEGFGTYASPYVWKNLGKTEMHKNNYSFFERAKLAGFVTSKVTLEKIALKYLSSESRFLFQQSDQLEPNEDIVSSYKKVLGFRKKKLVNDENTVLLVTADYSEYGFVTPEEEFALVESLIKFIDEKGFKVILKPHPREDSRKFSSLQEKYNVEIIQKDFPVEDILLTLNPTCIIGYNSTCLINAKLFYDIMSFSLVNMLISISNDEMFSYAIKEFKSLTGNIVEFVDEFEEIGLSTTSK